MSDHHQTAGLKTFLAIVFRSLEFRHCDSEPCPTLATTRSCSNSSVVSLVARAAFKRG